MKLQNGAEITVTTELDPASFLANFDEIRDTLWDTVEDALPETPAEESKGNSLNFETENRELWIILTDRLTGYHKKFHIYDADIDDEGFVRLDLKLSNGKTDSIKFPYTRSYKQFHNFKYWLEVAGTKEELEDNI